MSTEIRTCANCQAAIERPGGRRPRSGVWYCTQPACVAAKARATRAALRGPTDPKTCSQCGVELENAGGRPPSDGLWCCSGYECKRARARSRYRPAVVELDTRPCAHCGQAQKPKRKMATDSPEGRWCTNGSCQTAKAEVLAAKNAGLDALSSVFSRYKKRRTACPACHFTEVVPSFAHPLPDGSAPCFALSNVAPPYAQDMEYAWPDLMIKDPERLELVKKQLERAQEES